MKKNNKKFIILFIIIIIGLLLLFVTLINNKSNNKTNKKEIIDSKTQDILNKIKNNQEIMIYITDELDNCVNCGFGDMNINYYNKTYSLKIPSYNLSKDKDFKYILKELNFDKGNIYVPALIHIKEGIITSHNDIAHDADEIKKILIETNYINEKNNLDLGKIIDEKEFKVLKEESKNNLFILLAVNEKSYELRSNINSIAKKYNLNYYVIDFSKESIFSILDQLEKINNDNLPKEIFITNNNKIVSSIENKDINKIENFIKEYMEK